jgi:arginyl-tRNA synthetase
MKEEIIKHIEDILKEEGVENPKVNLAPSVYLDKGDYSTNVAMVYAKAVDNTPVYLSELIKRKLESRNIFGVTIANPGFINFFFDKKYFGENVKKIIEQGGEFGKNENLKGQKTIIEYTVCNVLKPMHIGHLMGNVIGESLSRIIEAEGAEVKRNNYQGDSGLHIAKAVWGIIKSGGKIDGTLSEKTKYIGDAYALGSNSYEDDESAQIEIKELNERIFKKEDENLNDIYKWGRQVSLDYFEELYKKLGTKFDYYFFESEVADDALKIVREFLAKGVFEESDGAVVFKGEKYDPKLHTRVFISSQGIPMYEAKDIAHALRKYDTYKFDKSIIVTANEQSQYFKVVLRALQEVNPEIAGKTEHVAHGLLKLPTGKMSSRKGNTITGETLINDVEEMVREKIKDSEFSDTEKDGIAEVVAIGAIKYSILHQAIGGDIIFDFDKSISFEGDSGPYLQYSAVRAHSLLKKADGVVSVSKNIPENWETTILERILERFQDIVARAGSEYAPHYIATYLIELAGEFNSFYAQHKIIDEGDLSSPYRLAVTQAFYQVMLTGLDLLGIKVPEKM